VNSEVSVRGLDVNNIPLDKDVEKMRSLSTSTSSLQVKVPLHQTADHEVTEDEENDGVGGVRKKMRLSKEQSVFLEDSFKEHSTLIPVCVLSYSSNHRCFFLFI
jgi:homeobox-leucine zipper protein